jgi:hypothetical protein
MLVTPLLPHPSTPEDALTAVTVEVDSLTTDLLVFYYRVAGDIDRLRLPPQAPSRSQHELWKHTCFEAFIALPDSDVYFEFNFSPSSQWAVYRFDGYRQNMTSLQPVPAPRVICRRRNDELQADVDIHLASIPELQAARQLKLALATVIENDQQRISYWALAHPPGKPDFHHRDGFALALAGDPS